MNYTGNPTFCAIAPISYSHLVGDRAAHLVLAHLLDKDYQPAEKHAHVDAYIDFIKAEKAKGSFVMCDNGSYELHESYEPSKLLGLSQIIGADAIVLPDYPFEHSSKTIEAAEKFAPVFKEAGFKNFFVPQSRRGDIEDWINAYLWASENPLIDIIGISILGVPAAWSHIDPAFARVVAMNELKARGIYNSDKHHHFLGLNAGPALEIPSLLRMGVLDTIDSSGPVWAAINGHAYTREADSYQTIRKLTNPVDFYLPMTKDQRTIDRILHNVQMTDELFTESVYGKPSVWYAEE